MPLHNRDYYRDPSHQRTRRASSQEEDAPLAAAAALNEQEQLDAETRRWAKVCPNCKGAGKMMGGQAHYLGGRVMPCNVCDGAGIVRKTEGERSMDVDPTAVAQKEDLREIVHVSRNAPPVFDQPKAQAGRSKRPMSAFAQVLMFALVLGVLFFIAMYMASQSG